MKIILLLSLITFSTPALAWNRIVTLNPMISEWTAEVLGKEKSLQKIVGASEYSNYPDFMKKVDTVGPYPQVQIEKILSLNPDIIVASSEYNRPDQLEQLRKLKLKVVTLPREEFLKMEGWITELGRVLGEDARAKVVVGEWRRGLAALKPRARVKRVFFEIQYQPLITVGHESFMNEAFEKIGYENIFSDLPLAYPKISKEAVLEKNPEEVLVFEMVKDQADLEKINETWKKSKVRVLSGDRFARCSLRLLTALKELELP